MKIPKFRGHFLLWAVHATSHALMTSQNYLILPVLLVVGTVRSYAQTPDPRPEHAAVQPDRPPLTPLAMRRSVHTTHTSHEERTSPKSWCQ